MSFFESNLKLFKSTDVDVDFKSQGFIHSLRAIIIAILAESNDDLILSSNLSTYSVQELQEATKVKYEHDLETIEDVTYSIDTLVVSFPNNIIKKQALTFIRTIEKTKKTYTTLILARGSAKLLTFVLQWLKSETGFYFKPLKFDSDFLIECMNIVIDGLQDDMVRLGDLELSFDIKTQQNNLSSIGIDIPHKEIIKLAKESKEDGLKNTIYQFLLESTSIDFAMFDLAKFKCNFLFITKDGKLKFFKGIPRKGTSDTIGFTAWDFVQKIYNIL
ncbi:hypothetical protein BN7_6553 [Wickerhamomyces ciferrii]|uniref:Uncharacterized protein n=1 Tax=Wickerhamomyces ciferrii (strain ATCC 14091 / BCRC 22168 / CBS 111 / JCM 3599 / NBRC 0793 / NRRL Y-1031 F-60-10) TaxID=1206466 RepID=K0KXZ9_WICCF|nr:uncharacterized protein BN7_6553 [Wickerhamomyces ciferrii]CCH46947.1 hypothetical protein BN7_6553 [Wickerhamomyces ciferrii]